MLKKKARLPRKPIKLDEIIVIPKFDNNNLTYKQMQILQDLLDMKSKQEKLRREHQQKQVEIKDIFFDAYDIKDVDEKAPIMDRLVHIVENLNDEDIDANERLL